MSCTPRGILELYRSSRVRMFEADDWKSTTVLAENAVNMKINVKHSVRVTMRPEALFGSSGYPCWQTAPIVNMKESQMLSLSMSECGCSSFSRRTFHSTTEARYRNSEDIARKAMSVSHRFVSKGSVKMFAT